MLPYSEIWENIVNIQDYQLPCNMRKTKEKVDLKLDDFLELKNEFIISTIEYAQNIDKIMEAHSQYIDFTFRYKEDDSIKRNWNKDNITKPLFKILNDIIGLRFVLPVSREELKETVEDFISSCPNGKEKCRFTDLERDGYHGQHLYIKFNNNVFPIEVQFWTRTDALLNQYLRDNIYARIDNEDIITYARSLRQWLEDIPQMPESCGIKSYIDYLYEKAFQCNKGEVLKNV
ncbi:hypothetical protein JOC37_001349 [Desulfohalotomaculum tongense]|uniref:hypothetical protein n=1 Tax=Desulforadius tongensis TaxID=1216062 RepID=UPI00195A80E7|nr:hypothetical protein [Desulforadius tongensis]MBM7854969.1 hypothetical protein [Desulforadius tongensis]